MSMPEIANVRVLIVDDIPLNLKIMTRALAPEFSADIALSGQEALAKLATGELPGLILLDVVMPTMDGYEVCHQLKTVPRTRDIPVIFVTARNDLEDEMGAMLAYMAGAEDFIHKPINPQVLRQRVRTQILLRERGQELLRLKEEMRQRSCYDPVTGLPNRPLLMDRFQRHSNYSAYSQEGGTLLFIALKDIATIYMTLGQVIGDQLLQQVARRLTDCARVGDIVARFGEGEFVVVLDDQTDNGRFTDAQVQTIAESILLTLSQPYRLGESDHSCTALIGIIRSRNHKIATGELLKGASLAMHQANSGTHSALRFLDPAILAALAAGQP